MAKEAGNDNFESQTEGIVFVLRSLVGLLSNRGFIEETTKDIWLDMLKHKNSKPEPTHCDKGHPWENGSKKCRTCYREYMREWRRKQDQGG